jgi:hypothetical protein
MLHIIIIILPQKEHHADPCARPWHAWQTTISSSSKTTDE